MKPASLKEIKTELFSLHPKRIQELCLQMARFRKENKELLSYLLFEAQDEKSYIIEIKSEIDDLFKEVKKSNSYVAVSYTHLRAHETDSYLVCRLLLEKKK